MARRQKLKVFRTPIGFHDAYVAATSQKEALKAWGADADLFARGVAEAVADGPVMAEALEQPGVIIRHLRGTSAEHMAELPKDEVRPRERQQASSDDGPAPRRRKAQTKRFPPARRAQRMAPPASATATRPLAGPQKILTKPKPRPSRARLERAERDVDQPKSDRKADIAELREQAKALQQRRRMLEARYERTAQRLDKAVGKVRDAYSAALQTWRYD